MTSTKIKIVQIIIAIVLIVALWGISPWLSLIGLVPFACGLLSGLLFSRVFLYKKLILELLLEFLEFLGFAFYIFTYFYVVLCI